MLTCSHTRVPHIKVLVGTKACIQQIKPIICKLATLLPLAYLTGSLSDKWVWCAICAANAIMVVTHFRIRPRAAPVNICEIDKASYWTIKYRGLIYEFVATDDDLCHSGIVACSQTWKVNDLYLYLYLYLYPYPYPYPYPYLYLYLYIYIYTVQCRYNAVNLHTNPHNRHPMTRP